MNPYWNCIKFCFTRRNRTPDDCLFGNSMVIPFPNVKKAQQATFAAATSVTSRTFSGNVYGRRIHVCSW